jgi:TPR repeat protein
VSKNYQREYHPAWVNIERINRDIQLFETLYGGGSKRAAVHLGMLYEQKGDLSQAESWYWRATLSKKHSRNDDSSTRPQGSDDQTSLEIYRRAALGNNPVLLYFYALLIAERSANPERAIFWHEQAAKAGHQDAIQRLADYYWAGKLAQRDIERSCTWMALSETSVILQIRRNIVCTVVKLVKKADGHADATEAAAGQ